jgi:hypothetical protein
MPRLMRCFSLVDLEHDALDGVALLQDLVGVRDLLGPRHVADVEQAVDARLDLDERAVVGEVADLAFDHGARGVLLADELPGVDLDLLHAEADFLLVLVDLEHDDVHFLVRRDQSRTG